MLRSLRQRSRQMRFKQQPGRESRAPEGLQENMGATHARGMWPCCTSFMRMSLVLALRNPPPPAPVMKQELQAGITTAIVKHMWLGSDLCPWLWEVPVSPVSFRGFVQLKGRFSGGSRTNFLETLKTRSGNRFSERKLQATKRPDQQQQLHVLILLLWQCGDTGATYWLSRERTPLETKLHFYLTSLFVKSVKRTFPYKTGFWRVNSWCNICVQVQLPSS